MKLDKALKGSSLIKCSQKNNNNLVDDYPFGRWIKFSEKLMFPRTCTFLCTFPRKFCYSLKG